MKVPALSPRERVWRAIRREDNPRPPQGELCLDDAGIRSVLGCERVGFEEKLRFVRCLGSDLICLSPIRPEVPGPHEYALPDLDRWIRDADLFTFVLLDGTFETGVRLFGFQTFLRRFRTDPDGVGAFAAVGAINAELMKRLADRGPQGAVPADDMDSQDELLLSLALFRDLFPPEPVRQEQTLRAQGLAVFFPSDGPYARIIPALVEAGFIGVHCSEIPCGMRLETPLPRHGGVLCLWDTSTPETATCSAPTRKSPERTRTRRP